MKTTSDTPPNGDFVRYVEDLVNRRAAQVAAIAAVSAPSPSPFVSAAPSAPGAQAKSRAPKRTAGASTTAGSATAAPALKKTLPAVTGSLPLMGIIRWAIVLWLLGSFLNSWRYGAGWMLWLAGLAYVGYAFKQAEHGSGPVWAKKIRILMDAFAARKRL